MNEYPESGAIRVMQAAEYDGQPWQRDYHTVKHAQGAWTVLKRSVPHHAVNSQQTGIHKEVHNHEHPILHPSSATGEADIVLEDGEVPIHAMAFRLIRRTCGLLG